MRSGDVTKPIRRVVTGHTTSHVARVLIDAPAKNRKLPAPGVVSTLIWSSDRAPAEIAEGEEIIDEGAKTLGTAPPRFGSRFCIIDFPPGRAGMLHRTNSLDYIVVLAGEITIRLDKELVRLATGDVVVQRGTNHTWNNESSTYARLAFVLLDAKPLPIGAPVEGSKVAGT